MTKIGEIAHAEELTRIWTCENGFRVEACFSWPGPVWNRKGERREVSWSAGPPVSSAEAREFAATIAEACEWVDSAAANTGAGSEE